jgi:hypothetical protein
MKKVLFTAMILVVFAFGCVSGPKDESKGNIQGLEKWTGARLYTISWDDVKDIYENEKMSEEEYKTYGYVKEKLVQFIWCQPDQSIAFDPKEGVLRFLSPCEVYQVYFESQRYGILTGSFMITGKSKLILNQKFADDECAYKTILLENSLGNKYKWEAYECRTANNKMWYEKVDGGIDVKK